MKWSDAYATGIPQVDRQHQMIFQMAEDFRASVETGEGANVYALFLKSLDSYAGAHFGFEERCMEQHRCPAAAQNRQAHAQFRTLLADFQQRLAANGFRHTDARELVDAIDAWLSSHICGIDLQLRRYAAPGSRHG